MKNHNFLHIFLALFFANFSLAGHYNETPLHTAVEINDIVSAMYLLEQDAQVNAVNRYGETPLHIAATEGYQEIAALLLEFQAPVDAQNNFGQTVLHKAANKGHLEIVRLLLDHGAEIDKKGPFGDTALYHASCHSHLETVSLLLRRGADIQKARSTWRHGLFWAALRKDQKRKIEEIETVKLLLANGAPERLPENLPQPENMWLKVSEVINQYNKITDYAKKNNILMPHVSKEAQFEILNNKFIITYNNNDLFFPEELYKIIFLNFDLNSFLNMQLVSRSHYVLVQDQALFHDLLSRSIISWKYILYFAEENNIDFDV